MEKQFTPHKKTLCLLMALTLSPAPVFAHLRHATALTPAMLSQQHDTVPGVFSSDYTTIKNVTMGNEQCLTLESDNKNVMFATCTNSNRQLWSFSTIMSGYLKITNQALAGSDKEYCLGTNGSSTSTPTMMECSGSGYTSQRSWQIPPNAASSAPGIVYRLVNKYRNDLGRNEVLGYSGNRLRMVAASNADNVSWQFSAPDILTKRPVTGERKVLLIHTHYSDRAAMDVKSVQAAVFGSGSDTSSLASAVAISSHGKLKLTGDTVTDINLGARPTTCPSGSAFVNRVRELARQKGINVANYNSTFVDMPSTPCSWTGLAAAPGNWIISNNAGNRHWMWQHEFGHNLGAPHATSLEGCGVNSSGVVQIDGNCRNTTVGDPSDTMNGGGRRLYPAPYALFAGWLTDNQFPLVTKSGDYTLTPLFDKADESHLKALRILRKNGSYLTLEYRQAAAGFENWPSDSPFVHGVIVRIATFGTRVTNQLVDTTPGSAGGMNDAPLMPGKSIDDLLSGKRITLLRVDAEGAHVRIQDIQEAQNEEKLVPIAVVPEDFSIVARHNSATIRNLDGSRSTGKEMVWRSMEGNGAFGLQEVASGPVVQEIRQPVVRAAFPAGATGKARYQLTVTGSHGATDSKIVTVTVLPAEVKISGKTSAEKGETLAFTSQANFDADSWRWSLKRGEQTVATGSQAAFNLETPQLAAGSYQLHLEASANNQQYLATATAVLTVTEQEKPDTPAIPDKPTYPAYVEGTAYKAGDKVSAAGGVYSCKGHPFTGWCAGAAWAYAPGTGLYWSEAWDKVN